MSELVLYLVDQSGSYPLVEDNGVFTLEETRHYLVTLAGAGASDVAHIDARPLVQVPGGWALPVGSWTSSKPLSISITRGGDALAGGLARVIPRAEKLPETLWATMMSELEMWMPSIGVGLEGGRAGAVGTRGVPAPLLAEALAPLVEPLILAVQPLLVRPRRRVAALLETVSLREARKADRDAVRWASRHPQWASALNPNRDEAIPTREPHLPQQRTEERLDHPVNCYLAWLLARVIRILRATSTRLGTVFTGEDDDESAAWRAARAERLARCAALVERVVERSFLRDLQPSPPTEAALLVIMNDPACARAHRLGHPFLSPLFQLDGETQSPGAASRPTFELYELWCLLAVQRQLAATLPDWTWKHRGLGALLRLEGTGAGAAFIGRSPSWDEIMVEFNPTFESWFVRRDALRFSISSERRPDLVVTWKRQNGSAAWLVLDAKWRAGRQNLGKAFESVHIYRDALRDETAGGRCRAALLVAPTASRDCTEWFGPAFRETNGCGIWELRPGSEGQPELGRWIAKTLSLDNPG